MAEVVSDETGRSPSAPAEPAPFIRPAQRDIVVNPRRFGVAYLVLAVGVGIAVGLGIVLLGRGGHHAAATTATTFKPTKSGELGAKEIARHVAHKYRLANGQELVGVIGERPNYQSLQLFNYLIRPHDAQYPNDVEPFPVNRGIMYSMCGFSGTTCGVAQTNATSELLKREALELAYETFKTDSTVDTVTTLFPPAAQTGVAVIFRRRQLAPLISQPLSKLLPEPGPFKPGSIGASELQRVDLIVAPSLYAYDTQLGPDGNPLLRLDPLG